MIADNMKNMIRLIHGIYVSKLHVLQYCQGQMIAINMMNTIRLTVGMCGNHDCLKYFWG